MKNKLILIIVFLSVLTNAQIKDTLTLITNEATVSAPRMNLTLREIPFSINILNSEELQSIPKGISIDEPLKFVPGVKIDNQANGNRIHMSIRGQGILTERGIRGIKILLDEIPINDPTGFAPDLFDIDFANVERIEVLRGPAASLYGGSATAGIINIISKNNPDKPLYAEAQGTFGSNNFSKGFGAFGGYANNVNYRVSFSRSLGDGYRDHTHFNLNNIYGILTYMPSEQIRITPLFSYTDAYHENPEGINLIQLSKNPLQSNPDAIPYNEYLETKRTTGGITGNIFINKENEVQFNGYVKRTIFTEANNHTFNHRTIITPGASFQYSLITSNPESFIKNKISAGADLQWQTINENRHANILSVEQAPVLSDEKIKQSGLGLFLVDKVDLGTAAGLMFSIRYDNITNELIDNMKTPNDLSGSSDFSKVTGRIGATYSPVSNYTVYANYGQGFLPPATEELAQNPDHFGGFNTHLTYAKSNEVDLGLRGNPVKEVYFDLSGFYMQTDNDFDRYRITDPARNQETFYRNASSSERFGFELSATVVPNSRLKFETAYTYSHFKYTNSTPLRIMMDDTTVFKYIKDGNYLPNSPQHQLFFDLQYLVYKDLTIGISSETMSKAFIDGANIESEAIEGYTLFNARISYVLNLLGSNVQLNFNMKNIADKKYVAFTEPDPGGNSYQPGSGREFFGSVKIKL